MTPSASPRARKAGEPENCAGLAGTGCIAEPTSAAITVHPLTDNPTVCTGEPLATSLEVQTYQDPEDPSSQTSAYPATTECLRETFYPVLYASPTTDQTDSPSGLNIELSDPQPLGYAIRSATVTLPEGLTINPDAADGQSDCTEAQANFA